MSECRFLRLDSIPQPPMPDIEEILREAALVLREKSYRPARYRDRRDLAYWVLMFIGADSMPLSGCGDRIPLGKLGFYRLSEYDEYSVARDPRDLVMAGKPTPLVRLRLFEEGGGPSVWAKLEWYNPHSLSVKDRVAWMMLRLCLEECRLLGYKGIVEASSSNTGIAIAALSNLIGVPAKIFLPATAPRENENILRLLGARVERSRMGVTTELLSLIKEEASRNHFYHPDQFNNDANLLAHMRYTARELLLQLRHAKVKPTSLVLASGTGGTASAVSFLLTNYYHKKPPRVFIVTPAPGESIEGVRRIETGVKWLPLVNVDYEVVEATRREALEGIMLTARLNGIIPGVSGGALATAIRRLWEKGSLSGDDVVVTLIPDTGFKYPAAVREIIEYSRTNNRSEQA